MTELEEYQEYVKSTTFGDDKGVPLLIMSNAFGGEVGELMNVVKKVYRDDNGIITDEKYEKLVDELGDVLWYVAALANTIDVSLDDVIAHNIDKLNKRNAHGKSA